MSEQLAIFRADASDAIGTGHVMRCLALAQAWRIRGGSALLASANVPTTLAQRFTRAGIAFTRINATRGSSQDAANLVYEAEKAGAAWIVLDGYHFNTDYQRAVKEGGLKLLVIDDKAHLRIYFADIILNQNLHADPAAYAGRAGDARLLLGTRYVLLRPEFTVHRGWRRPIAEVARHVLICVGGADRDGVTPKLIAALSDPQCEGLAVTVVVGAANLHIDALRQHLQRCPRMTTLVHDARDMPALIRSADLAVSSGGTTVWEMSMLGTPMVLGSIADVEVLLTASVANAGMALLVGWFRNVPTCEISSAIVRLAGDFALRQRLSTRAHDLVDGWGVERVVAAMSETARKGN